MNLALPLNEDDENDITEDASNKRITIMGAHETLALHDQD